MHPRRAFVEGFTLHIGQRATLMPMAGARAYGMLIALTHHDIAQLYAAPGLQHYLPEAVLAHTYGRPGRSSPLLQPCGATECLRAESWVCSPTQSCTSGTWFPCRVCCVHSIERVTSEQSLMRSVLPCGWAWWGHAGVYPRAQRLTTHWSRRRGSAGWIGVQRATRRRSAVAPGARLISIPLGRCLRYRVDNPVNIADK